MGSPLDGDTDIEDINGESVQHESIFIGSFFVDMLSVRAISETFVSVFNNLAVITLFMLPIVVVAYVSWSFHRAGGQSPASRPVVHVKLWWTK
jgi:hypothetical protein